MKQFILLGLIIINCLVYPVPILAHDKAQPYFLRLNDSYLDHYPIKSTSLPDFILPQEIDSTPLLVNQPITFEIEKNNIPLQDKKSADDSFIIDFGDGQKSNGIHLEHSYTQIGSYILTLSVKPLFAEHEIIFDHVLINIVPDKNYQLPQAVIKINNAASLPETVIDFRKQVSLDGIDSKSNNQIVNYLWDLGDGKSTDSSSVDHTYANYNFGANVLLRVKDQKGFIADSSIRLVDSQKQDTAPKNTNSLSPTILFLFLIGCLAIFSVVAFRLRRKP